MQTANIDLANGDWEPILLDSNCTYDGGGFYISNIYIQCGRSEWNEIGLFGTCEYSTIKNVNVLGFYAYCSSSYASAMGGIVAKASHSTISNCSVDWYSYGGEAVYAEAIGGICGISTQTTIIDCNVYSTDGVSLYLSEGTNSNSYGTFFGVGGILGKTYDFNNDGTIVKNCNFSGYGITMYDDYNYAGIESDCNFAVGGIFGGEYYGSHTQIIGCSSSGSLSVDTYYSWCGGIAGQGECIISACVSDINIGVSLRDAGVIGGICGNSSNIEQSIYLGTITLYGDSSSVSLSVGGIVGSCDATILQCSFDGTITFDDPISYLKVNLGGIVGNGYGSTIQYCTSNAIFSNGSVRLTGMIGGITTSNPSIIKGCISNVQVEGWDTISANSFQAICFGDTSTSVTKSYYNSDYLSHSNYGTALTSEQMKVRSSFNAMTEFDSYYEHVKGLNNGFPILKIFEGYAKFNGFEGSGTEADPYIIDSFPAFMFFTKVYEFDSVNWSNHSLYQAGIHWLLTTDIDISVDSLGNPIEWTPIGLDYDAAFNAHFDGGGHTISGMNITQQWEYAGLFAQTTGAEYAPIEGTDMSAPVPSTIKNLNVTGTIAWDQAKYVGGIVGNAYNTQVTDCTFNGTISGYLNSGNISVVNGIAGKLDSSTITGSANYDCYVYGTNNYTTFNRYNTIYSQVS